MSERKPYPLISHVVLNGTLTQDPDVRENRDGEYTLVKFAVRNRWASYDTEDLEEGEFSEEDSALFVSSFVGGGWGRYIADNFGKGDRIVLIGDLYYKRDAWEDRDGNPRDDWNLRYVTYAGPDNRFYGSDGNGGGGSYRSGSRGGRSRSRRGSDDRGRSRGDEERLERRGRSDESADRPRRRTRRSEDEDVVERPRSRRRTSSDDSADSGEVRRRPVLNHGDE